MDSWASVSEASRSILLINATISWLVAGSEAAIRVR